MRALTLSAHGTVDDLLVRDDLPEPVAGPGQVKIRITAAALNQLDLFVIRGLPGIKPDFPWIMTGDATGSIHSVGAGVAGVTAGDHVLINPGVSDRSCEYCLAGEHSLCIRYGILGEHFPGSAAEYLVVPQENVRVIPAEAPAPEAAAFTLAALTAWRMLVTRAQLVEGEDILIQGIGGGVAQAAFAIATHLGARVWVTSTSDAKLERAMEMGAFAAINNQREDVGKLVRDRTNKRGVDVVMDNVGEATWRGSLAALGKRGRLVTCGGTSGPMVETDVRRLFWNQYSILGSTMGNDAEFDAIAEHFRAGRLYPVIDSVFGLSDGKRAFERLQSGEQFGKVVLRIPE